MTKTYPTNCPECASPVWFFSCSCGSKIFFEELGHPWEQHVCRKYLLSLEISLIKDSERLSDEEIYKIITNIEKKRGHSVDDGTMEILEDILGKRKYLFSATEVEPSTATEFAGRVMELNNPINIFKKLAYDATNQLSIRLLGKIGETKWAMVKVRGNPDGRNHALEYSIYVRESYLKLYPIRQGQYIIGVLDVLKHPKGLMWVLREHKAI